MDEERITEYQMMTGTARIIRVLLVPYFMLLIYYFPILGVNSLHIIGALAWVYLILDNKNAFRFTQRSRVVWVFFGFTGIALYLITVIWVNGESYSNAGGYLYLLVEVLPACLAATLLARKHGLSLEDFLRALLWAGMLQALCAIVAFVLPAFQTWVIDTLIAYGYSDTLRTYIGNRMYGIASNMLFATSQAQASLAVIAMYMAWHIRWRYLLFVPFLAFSSVINTRSAIIVIAWGALSLFLCTIRISRRTATRILCVMLVIFIGAGLFFIVLGESSNVTFNWVYTGVIEIFRFLFAGEATGYFEVISTPEWYKLPEGMDLFFGKGVGAMGGNRHGAHSDIGYVNEVWLGGVVYCAMVYCAFASLIFFLYRTLRSTQKRLGIFLACFYCGCLLLLNIKGVIMWMNDFTTIFFLLLAFIIYTRGRPAR